jgi:hypothetical protein
MRHLLLAGVCLLSACGDRGLSSGAFAPMSSAIVRVAPRATANEIATSTEALVDATTAGGLTTTKAGGTATFELVLDAPPTDNVIVTISSSNQSAGVVSTPAGPAHALTFAPSNWSTPQAVVLAGVGDFVADGTQAYSVAYAATSTDASYNGLAATMFNVSNLDDNYAQVRITTGGLSTSSSGGTATFTVNLTSQPLATVTVALASSDTTQGTIAPATLTFDASNWSVPQLATLSGAANSYAATSANTYYAVVGPITSTDATYAGLPTQELLVSNEDSNVARFVLTTAGGLDTSHGGDTASFTIALACEPRANVTLPISSDDTTAGTLSAPSLTFTAANWSTPQTVIITGANVMPYTVDVAYHVDFGASVSADPAYSGLTLTPLLVTNHDCLDTQTTVNNCGVCGNVCALDGNASAVSCVSGACAQTCNAGYGVCGASCCALTGMWRASTSATGAEPNATSDVYFKSLSADNHLITFVSQATNLNAAATNGKWQVYVKNLNTGALELISTSALGVQGDGDSLYASMSKDGRYITFQSLATNLVANDTNAASDVFRYDRQTATMLRVSVSNDPTPVQGNGAATWPSVSDDGNLIAFQSTASNLVASDTNAHADTFVRDVSGAQTGIVSIDSAGDEGNGDVQGYPSLDGDGRYVAFATKATNLGDSAPGTFIRDRQLNVTTLASTNASGVAANAAAEQPQLSSTGAYIVFWVDATTNMGGISFNVVAKNLSTGAITAPVTSAVGVAGNDAGYTASITTDGTYVAFNSDASNLVPYDSTGMLDGYIKDIVTGAIDRFPGAGSPAPDGFTWQALVTDDASAVELSTLATNLGTGPDTNGVQDVYIYFR